MFAIVAALAAIYLLAAGAHAQTSNGTGERRYVVWSSVIFTRTGERTPEILGKIPTQLTSVGAQQAYAAGQFFRNRYTILRNGSNGAESAGAELIGLSDVLYDQNQVVSMALEQQYNLATQQAFMQGLYPPTSLGNSSTTGGQFNGMNSLANGSYVSTPLNGYQYTQLRSAGPLDVDFVYLSGNLNCPAWAESVKLARATPSYDGTQEEFNGLYDVAGSATLIGVLPTYYWDYDNAYAIYDYLRYENEYNKTVRDAMQGLRWATTNGSFLDTLRYLSDQQQYAMLGNLSAQNIYLKKHTLTSAAGSISTIAGNTFAARVMDSLSSAIDAAAYGQYKLNLFFIDYPPMTSFFSLMGLPDLNPDFHGTPHFASSLAFELFSYTNETNPTFPASTTDLWVRFFFRNGTEGGDEGGFRAYPLFNRGPDQTDMQWSDFSYAMQNNALGGIGTWCNECQASSFFCAAFDQNGNEVGAGTTARATASSKHLSPAVAGVVGGIVALVIAGLVFGLAMLVGGMRLHRRGGRKSDFLGGGGFKGGQKMRSDQDLSIPKGGAIVVGASVVDSPSQHGGHERVGSWELKLGKNLDVPQDDRTNSSESLRPSMEEIGRHDHVHHDPFADPEGLKPIQTREHV